MHPVQYPTWRILEVYLWAVLHDRPTVWACQARNWPPDQQDGDLPSASCLSRRLRRPEVQGLLRACEDAFRRRYGHTLYRCIDAMPLVIGGSSGDRQAGYGRAAASQAKGYKFFAICTPQGVVETWRVGPMNYSEKTMASRLLREIEGQGYLVGDGEYDCNPLYDYAGAKGIQLLAPKRTGGLGHRRHSPYRLRSMELTARPFGQQLLHHRASIDRFFGQWNSSGCGIKHLPPWVRTHRRVRLWGQAKLILHYIRTEVTRLTG
jgi:hypothetical protein